MTGEKEFPGVQKGKGEKLFPEQHFSFKLGLVSSHTFAHLSLKATYITDFKVMKVF